MPVMSVSYKPRGIVKTKTLVKNTNLKALLNALGAENNFAMAIKTAAEVAEKMGSKVEKNLFSPEVQRALNLKEKASLDQCNSYNNNLISVGKRIYLYRPQGDNVYIVDLTDASFIKSQQARAKNQAAELEYMRSILSIRKSPIRHP